MYILFSDIDGTLLNNKKEISPALHREILNFTNAGNVFVLCSGRPEQSIINLKEDLHLPDHNIYISSCNGAKLLDLENHKIVYQEGIPIELARNVLDAAYSLDLHCHTYNDLAIISEKNTPELSHYVRHVTIPVYITEDFSTRVKNEVPKILAISFEQQELFHELQKKIEKISHNTLTSLCSNPNYFEIFSKKAGKGTSVSKLVDYLSIPWEHTIAVGDAPNDISMLKAVNFGYAMQNANDETKNAAKFITQKTNDEDGLIEILSHYLQ